MHEQGFPSMFDHVQPYQRQRLTPASLRRLTGGTCSPEVLSDAPTKAPATVFVEAGVSRWKICAPSVLSERRGLVRPSPLSRQSDSFLPLAARRSIIIAAT
jgi:hypothetical protein